MSSHGEGAHIYTLREIVEMLIKQAGVHEGLWTLSLGLQIGVGHYGPTADQSFPGGAVTLQNLGIQKHPPGAPLAPGGFVVDAAVVNPFVAPPTSDKKAKPVKRRKSEGTD